ncbi:ABC transporter permease [Adlercreutzia muris]|uniref:ABC transporter permease n=1 Tax=Adlercreutzia muris TaxID=1796610 RepID=UPI001F583C55|nr:ABC transporter permease [Adlercreutzia muris]
MQANLRKLGALIAKDAADLAKNPTMILCVLMPVGFAVFYRFFIGDMGLAGSLRDDGGLGASPQVTSVVQYIVLSMSLCLSIGMGASVSLIYGLAEEKEKHTLRTLMLANVSAEQLMLAKGFVAFVLTIATELVCFAVSGAPWSLAGWYLLLGSVGAVPVILVSLVVGLASRDQMTAGLYSVPVLLLTMAPIFGSFSEGIRAVVRFAPTGGADELLRLIVSGSLTPAAAVAPLAVTAVWMVAAVVVFKLLYRRLLRDN